MFLTQMPPAFTYTETLVTLSAGQAAGTTPIMEANPARVGFCIISPRGTELDAECRFSPFTGPGQGVTLWAQTTWLWESRRCPSNAIYIYGLAAGDKVVTWQA